MSGQPPQRVRRNVSPSTKQGPIKAVKAFSLKQGSPTRCLNSSPPANLRAESHKIWSRKSPDNRLSPERRSPNSPCSKGSDKKLLVSPVPCGSSLWRASSLDTLGPYLTGQWPKDPGAFQFALSETLMCDKSTQVCDETSEELDIAACLEKKRTKKGHRRSASFGHGDQLKEFRQRLQQSRGSKHRQSPVPGNHSALSSTAPASLTIFSQSKNLLIPCPSPRGSMSRFQRNSVEGLNMEIEKLVLTRDSGNDSDEIEVPDGHRAPPPELARSSSVRSVDTQTPSALTDEGRNSSGCSRCDSISPGNGFSPGWSLDYQSRWDSETAQDTPSPSITKFIPSPKLDDSKNFVREPPDGCEKVKVIEEHRNPTIKEPLLFALKPNLVFKQSAGSAFCPPYKAFCPPPVPTTTIEGQ